ncbi:MAG TPA: DUF2946 family protein [Reyranella sp.]|jgi:hypothetical protein|nr:DUF2946 family protein [Reyranella sp.]
MRDSTGSVWRHPALAVALFAITLNFLQPLAHAALMKGGAPGEFRSALCNSSRANTDESSTPAPAVAEHDCCLGPVNAAPFITPSSEFVTVAPLALPATGFASNSQAPPISIGDGPGQPRDPPVRA